MSGGIKQRTTVTRREHEAVAVGPLCVKRVHLEKAVPQGVSHGCGAQGQSGMTRVGLLHHVHGQEAECVDTQLIQFGRREGGRKFHGCAVPPLVAMELMRLTPRR